MKKILLILFSAAVFTTMNIHIAQSMDIPSEAQDQREEQCLICFNSYSSSMHPPCCQALQCVNCVRESLAGHAAQLLFTQLQIETSDEEEEVEEKTPAYTSLQCAFCKKNMFNNAYENNTLYLALVMNGWTNYDAQVATALSKLEKEKQEQETEDYLAAERLQMEQLEAANQAAIAALVAQDLHAFDMQQELAAQEEEEDPVEEVD